MSRYVTLVLTGVSAVALSTIAVPVGQAAPDAGSADLTSVTTSAGKTTKGDRVGSWCC